MMNNASSTSISAPAFKAVLLALLLLALPVAAQAQETTQAAPRSVGMGKIAVVDLQYLIASSKAGKSIRNQLDAKRNAYRGQIEKQEADLRNGEKALVAQQEGASKEDFLKQRKAFQQKVMDAQRSVQERRIAFDKAYTTSLEKLREHIVKIVADLAGKNNIALVLNRQEVVLVEANMDITKDVLSQLDAKVSSIPVSVK